MDLLNSQNICSRYHLNLSVDNNISRIANWYEVSNYFSTEPDIVNETPVKVLERQNNTSTKTDTTIWKVETREHKIVTLSEAYLSPVCINAAMEKEFLSLAMKFDVSEKRQHNKNSENSRKEPVNKIREER